MPASRNNENQQPHRNISQTPSIPYRGYESRRPESSIRDVKPDIDVKPDLEAGTHGADQGYTMNPAPTPSTLQTRPLNTGTPSAPFAALRLHNPSHNPQIAEWMARQPISHNSPATGTPNYADPRTLPLDSDQAADLQPLLPTPGMGRSRIQEIDPRTVPSNYSHGPPVRQLPESFVTRPPSINIDTPTSAYESGMDDQLHSPNYHQDISPTDVTTSNAGMPLTTAIPYTTDTGTHATGMMNPPDNTTRQTQRRATLAGQGPRYTPYNHTPGPHARAQRAPSTLRNPPAQSPRQPVNGTRQMLAYGGGNIRAAVGIGHPGNGIDGRNRAGSITTADIARRFISEGHPVPSVLAPAEPVGPSLIAPRSIPQSPMDQVPSVPLVPSTPLTTFPGEPHTPQVIVPGNTHAQTPSAVPAGTPGIDADGNEWSGVGLPQFYSTQIGDPPSRSVKARAALEEAKVGPIIGTIEPPMIPVPTPSDSANSIRLDAITAIKNLIKDDAANFADPEHYVHFLRYVDIATSDGTSDPSLGNTLARVFTHFSRGIRHYAGYKIQIGDDVPPALTNALYSIFRRGVRMWGRNAYVTEAFLVRYDWVRTEMDKQAREKEETMAVDDQNED